MVAESDADFPGEIRYQKLSKLPLFELDSEGWNCNWFKTLKPEKQDRRTDELRKSTWQWRVQLI